MVLPYTYADQSPVLAAITSGAKQRSKATPLYSTQQLIGTIQRACRYPSTALRQMQVGVVYVYFEVAENGTIESPEVVGTISPELDEETVRVVKLLPAAISPALLKGQPVRVSYVLPMTWRFQ